MDILLVWILGLAIFFGIVFTLLLVIVWGTRAILGPRRRLEERLGLEVLQRRLDRGEITQEQYDQAKRALGL